MKITLFSHTGNVTGGAEQCLLEYVDVLIKRGHKCRVIIPNKGPMSSELTSRKIDWTCIAYGWATKPHRKVNPRRILASTGSSIARIMQDIEKTKPDIIITNTAVIPWGLYAGRAYKIPTILLVHEILSDKDPSLDMAPNYTEYCKIINMNTDYIVYNSEFVKKEFSNLIKTPKTSKNIMYPLPPLDYKTIDKYYKKNEISNELRIAIFGAISPRKNQMEALIAAKILKHYGINKFKIDLYGDTKANIKYTKEIRKYIKNNSLTKFVKIKGFSSDVYSRMNEYNLILSTATYEPFGRAIIEGQLFGRVVIANNTGGGMELVEDKYNGLLYENGNPEALADKIKWVINNEHKAISLGLQAKQTQYKRYINDQRYEPLIESVDYFRGVKNNFKSLDYYDPILSLFEYNHYLNNRYKYIYRLTHNRATRYIKNNIRKVVVLAKKALS